MNKIAFLQGYIAKTAVWTGYTAETGATTATDKRKNKGEEFGEGEEIYNEGSPVGIKDYEGGGDAGVVGLAKGASNMFMAGAKEKRKTLADKFPGAPVKPITAPELKPPSIPPVKPLTVPNIKQGTI